MAKDRYRNCPPQKTIYMRLKKMHTGRMPTDRRLLYRGVKPIKRYRLDWTTLKERLAAFSRRLKEKKA